MVAMHQCDNAQNGRTALHLASFGGHLEATQLLLKAGIDFTVTDKVLVFCECELTHQFPGRQTGFFGVV